LEEIMMKAGDIAKALGLAICGDPELLVRKPAGLYDAVRGSVTWIKVLSSSSIETLSKLDGALIVHPPTEDLDMETKLAAVAEKNALLKTETPRLVFARLLEKFFPALQAHVASGIDETAKIDPSAHLGDRVTVGAFCVIGPDVVIGSNTVLHPHVIVYSGSQIGQRCVINSGVAIGTRGFGFVKDEDEEQVHFPQVGKVIIEDDVEIQSNTTVARPGLGVTRVERGAKIDCLCHIGHNARVGRRAIITACTEIGAGVVVGESAWIGPNTCSLEGVNFGSDSFTGIGSVVLRDVPAGKTVAGSPAAPILEIKRARAALRKLMDGEQK
jgi:UDP-3-O-[3-hydroxymyristoyl] glucosamine N-acyltransferase